MANPSKLLKLENEVPPDIWREIAELLNPIDVVALGETCRALHEAMAERTLWLNLLKAVCMEYDLFLPSYPIDEMSVTQLRRAALGPHLWIQRVYKNAVSPNVPFYNLGTNVLPPVSTIPFNGQLNSDRLHHLVPGGRFLITCGAEHGDRDPRASDIFTLKLWDLGLTGRKPLSQPLLLASRDIGPRLENYDIEMDCSIRNNGTLAVALSTVTSNLSHLNRCCLFRVFVISPHWPNPSFDQLSSMSADYSSHIFSTPEAFCLRGDKVLAQFDNVLVVWDFIVSLYAIVPLGLEGRALSRTNQFLLSGDLLILVTVPGVRQYLLSQWTALPDTKVPHLEIPTPTPTCSQSPHITLPPHSVDGDHNVVHISPSSISLPLTWDINEISSTSPAGRVQNQRFTLSGDMRGLSIDHVGTYKVPSGNWAPPSRRVVAWNGKAPLTLLKMLPYHWDAPQAHLISRFGPQPTDVLYWISPCGNNPSTSQSEEVPGQTHIMGCASLGYGGVVASCTATGRFIVNMEYGIRGRRMSLVDYMA